MRLSGYLLIACASATLCAPLKAYAQAVATTEEQKRAQLERQLNELKAMKESFNTRIDEVEKELRASQPSSPQLPQRPPAPVSAVAVPPANNIAEPPTDAGYGVTTTAANPPESNGTVGFGSWGTYEPGKGLVAVRGSKGEFALSFIAYVRYLNQLALDRTFTDSFGRTSTLDLRQDIQVNKINLSFKGWLFDPDFAYRVWIWTQNPSQGLGAQVVVGGHFTYHFNDYFNFSAGVGPNPSTRSTNWTYPYWMKMDNRMMADEFFRASYTMGIWADGQIAKGLRYRIMLGNNLSQLGVDASQLDAGLNTVSGTVWWMPTTGEYGPVEEFGDYAYHEQLATRFGVHYTRSREDAQAQSGVNDFENSQIRLSDGTRVFQPDAFDTGGQINKATYQMAAANAGLKYQGWALEGEYYMRWVDEFKSTGFIPVDDLFDHGFQVIASAVPVRDQLQVYLAGSKIFGEYGEPWDLATGLDWFPFSRREMRVNAQAVYLDRSPVGNTSLPYPVGGDGWFFNVDWIVAL